MLSLLFGVMAAALLLGVPIVISIGLGTFAALLHTGTPLIVLAQSIYTATDTFPLHAIPLFILAGALMEEARMSEQIVQVVEAAVGRIRGGLAMAVVVGCMIFAAMSGSGPAVAAAIGFIIVPTMVERKYDESFSAALTASAGTLGILIPPSNPMIIYGVVAQASIVGLFVAGIVPGLFVSVVLMLVAYFVCRKRQYGRKTQQFSMRHFLATAWRNKYSLLAPVIVLGGIYGGIVTPVEASIVAVLYALFVGAVVNSSLTWTKIYRSFTRTSLIGGSMIILIGLSTAFGELLTLGQVPQRVAEVLGAISENWRVVYLVVIGFLIILGTFMDTNATIIILTPILLPVFVKLGMHPIHFGIVFVVTNEIAFLTPPVGANLFAMTGVTQVPIEQIAREEIVFMIALILAVIVIALVPEITLFLPRIAGFL